MTSPVSYQRHGNIGVITIDNPPVNALGQAVRQGLMDAVALGNEDSEAQVLVLNARGRTFIAGADIREFGKPPQTPILPEVITKLEASTKPIVAVLHGNALGGGLEVALGCQLRVVLPGTKVGLPEVKLGLLPGAGGTQRLPRLTGVEAALDLITSGRFADADEALALGIVDAVSDADDPLEAGLAAARDVLAGKCTPRVTAELPPPAADPAAIERYRTKLQSEVPELYSPFRCVDAIALSTDGSLADGVRRERELFFACMDSPQRAGLIHAFFAARTPHKVPEVGEAAALTRLALLGTHPLFERLRSKAERAGIELTSAPDADTQACLIAPGAASDYTKSYAKSCAETCLKVALLSPEQAQELDATDADLALVSADGGMAELVVLRTSAEQQQAVANALKALRLPMVVSRQGSLLATLTQAAGDDVANSRAAMEAASLMLAERGWAYRTSDIDLLAIEALGYPRHLGGPHRQASQATGGECLS
ncbi:enoyl-CoA hydratase/isomerase family protein [Billgrantia kenyensis]|uniref:Enoyl-CoA hydratase/isomerase family protein n=1 Tax=Billgrantia kenyensis TaxID=321266 RepID=A0A7V9VXY9_9GAMM|nr:enoyl-CoA hydratase/isomerase family protein [Halomonas kenyensis]MBA2777469.1 enoyl-CoA hydratase/isomerase family protein [Halomonas kenyensis]MCG6660139.1 enoyl-CoA hydratase/isomerase family protein [Halomonas kenyensis]